MQEKILQMLREKEVSFVDFEHEPSGPSVLSAEVRARHGHPETVGAKALVMQITLSAGEKKTVLCVVPSVKLLDKKKLKMAIPHMKSFRFLTKEELFDLSGLIPGSVPPFGKPFINTDWFFVDESLRSEKALGFNCASLTHSVVISGSEYFKTVSPDQICSLVE